MFHMPAFIFVGGVFAKKLFSQEKGLRVDTIAFYIIMGVVFYVSLWVFSHLYDENPGFNLFRVGSIPWYFFAMGALGLSTPVLANLRWGWKLAVPAAVLLGVIAGFSKDFNDFLCLGRIATYAPFYFAGYYLDGRRFAGWIAERRRSVAWVTLSLVFLVLLFVAMYKLPTNIVSTMSGIATGHNSYEAMKAFPSEIDALFRVVDYAIATVMILVVSILTPQRECFISNLGQRTLQVYITHPFIYYFVSGFGLMRPLVSYLPWSGFAVIVVSIALAIVLALPQTPGRLLGKMRKLIRIDVHDVP